MAAPTPISALVHSSTLVTAGVYILIRFYPFLSKFRLLIFLFGIVTSLIASFRAIVENDFKKIIALSTLSQLGIIIFTLSLSPNLALIHLYIHASFKALIFISAGKIIFRFSNLQDIRKFGKMSRSLPLRALFMNLSNLALCGFPFLSGFYSKDLIIEKFLVLNFVYFVKFSILVSVILTSVYAFRLMVLYSLIWSSELPIFHISKDSADFIELSMFILGVRTIFLAPWISMLIYNPMDLILLTSTGKVIPLFIISLGVLVSIIYINRFSLSKILRTLFFLNL